MQKEGKKQFNSKTLIILVIALLLVASAVGYTIARYVTTDSQYHTARVAKWDVNVQKATASFNLFDYVDASVDYDGNGSELVIAPGTTGSFSYELTNSSEVKASYQVNYTSDEAGVFLQWSVDGINWTDDIADIATTNIAMGETVEKTIYWKWAFESDGIAAGQSDISDTNLGIAGTATPNITIEVIFTQED